MLNTKKAVLVLWTLSVGIFALQRTVAGQEIKTRRITLDDAQAQASAADKAAELGRMSVDAARYHRKAVAADYFPKIDSEFFNLHFNKFMGQTVELARRTAGLPLLEKDQTIVSVGITQPVTPLLKVHQAVEIARADEIVAEAKAGQLPDQTAANVERAYFGLLIAQRNQAAAEAKVRMLEASLQVATTTAVPIGGMTERRRAFLEASKDLITADSRVTELSRSLNTLIGAPLETQLQLVTPEPLFENVSDQQATQQALANSAEIVEAQQTVVKANAATRLSKLDYVPEVAVIGGYIYERAVPLLPLDFSYIGVEASWTLFDFGKRERTVSERKAQLAMAEANVDLVKAKVAATAQKAFLELQRTRRIRDLTRQIAVSYRIDPIAYKKSDPEADASGAQAESEMLQAEMDYRAAYAQLKQIMDGR
jgi:outer membrane protein TolC